MPAPLDTLPKRADFLRVAAGGAKAVSPGLLLQSAPGEPGRQRIGLTASKKIGNAVRRNRARRRLRAAASLVLPTEAAIGRDYVLVARADTVTRPWLDLLADLRHGLGRLALGRRA
jgi:ribonuclease P protein component